MTRGWGTWERWFATTLCHVISGRGRTTTTFPGTPPFANRFTATVTTSPSFIVFLSLSLSLSSFFSLPLISCRSLSSLRFACITYPSGLVKISLSTHLIKFVTYNCSKQVLCFLLSPMRRASWSLTAYQKKCKQVNCTIHKNNQP